MHRDGLYYLNRNFCSRWMALYYNAHIFMVNLVDVSDGQVSIYFGRNGLYEYDCM